MLAWANATLVSKALRQHMGMLHASSGSKRAAMHNKCSMPNHAMDTTSSSCCKMMNSVGWQVDNGTAALELQHSIQSHAQLGNMSPVCPLCSKTCSLHQHTFSSKKCFCVAAQPPSLSLTVQMPFTLGSFDFFFRALSTGLQPASHH